MTISVAMLISAVNALTLSPALCAVFLRHQGRRRGPMGWVTTTKCPQPTVSAIWLRGLFLGEGECWRLLAAADSAKFLLLL